MDRTNVIIKCKYNLNLPAYMEEIHVYQFHPVRKRNFLMKDVKASFQF
jgi:hypothetical protein